MQLHDDIEKRLIIKKKNLNRNKLSNEINII